MFSKILIANRGEIACRIMRTAKRMGIATVAVYSDADRDALHVAMADEAVHIGPPEAVNSYLVIEKIIDACRQTGAEAVHPGYGFLSEREAFAVALSQAGIVFIGPNPGAIAAMGDKIESKKAAAAANVSTVPGYLGIIETPEHAAEIADGIGYPVMIKASAGGGGKGMRIANSRVEVEEGFTRAKSEAASSFGDDRVFVEKFITNPRHIEIQVLGDKHGNVIHLNERECSIQRRNQKVLEEAPSPLLDEATRARMGAEAVALAKAVNYDSAGTVEFVVGQDKSFFFLEMNTRLQVEHPVTELITGVDLVEEMIRVAAGETLRLTQGDVTIRGWSVEARIYAEDPTRDFLPSTGRLVRYQPPALGIKDGVTVRSDTGVGEGGEISIYYDPMIAKLVTHAPTRKEAIEAQSQALDAFVIEGIRHNIPFLSTLMSQERWRSGNLSTSYIADAFPAGFVVPEPEGALAVRLAAIALFVDQRMSARRRRISGQIETGTPRDAAGERIVMLSKRPMDARVAEVDLTTLSVEIAGSPAIDIRSDWKPGEPVWHGTLDTQPVVCQIRPLLNGFRLSHAGVSVETHVHSRREAELLTLMPEKKQAAAQKALLCPMPGLIKSIAVTDGEVVKAGAILAVIEAMKMENVLRADRDLTIKAVKAKPGDTLAFDAVILEFA